MSTNGNDEGGEIGQPAVVAKDANVVDVSIEAVNARLRAFVAEVRARPEGDAPPFRESDALLCAMAEDALAHVAKAEADLARCKANEERLDEAKRIDDAAREWRESGGRLQ
jgi:hypothetical protein